MTTPPRDPNANAKCGEPAASFIPRWGMSFACVLPKGHTGEHQQGGNCLKHGEYIGEQCPQWPNCTPAAPASAQPDRAEQLAREIGQLRVIVDAKAGIVRKVVELLDVAAFVPSIRTALDDAVREAVEIRDAEIFRLTVNHLRFQQAESALAINPACPRQHRMVDWVWHPQIVESGEAIRDGGWYECRACRSEDEAEQRGYQRGVNDGNKPLRF